MSTRWNPREMHSATLTENQESILLLKEATTREDIIIIRGQITVGF